MGKVQPLRNYLEQQKGKKTQLTNTLTLVRQDIAAKTASLHLHEQAREIVRTVGMATQSQISFHISDITSLALESVFNEPYQLKVEFVQRRNKTECDLFFERMGERMDPLTASGGGAVDVAAFALRIATWSMARPRTRNTIILDEPLRFLSTDNQEKASQMIKEISQKLGIQFILVTHSEVLTSSADKTFRVSIKNGRSKVTTNE